MHKVEVPIGLFGSNEPFFREAMGDQSPQCRMERMSGFGGRRKKRKAAKKGGGNAKEVVNTLLESATVVNNMVQGKNQFADNVAPQPKEEAKPKDDTNKKIIIGVAAVAGIALLATGVYFMTR